MTLDLERVSHEGASPEAIDQDTATARAGSLVIYLCKVGAPITIPQPRAPQLTRFSFFLSHSRRGNRTKYWLQMGYFSTHVEADRWLKILRGIYPGAFVSDVSTAQPKTLSDTLVSRILEQRGADGMSGSNEPEAGDLSLLRRAETGTRLMSVTSVHHRLKETLEILGKSELGVGSEDEATGTGVQDLRFELQKESPPIHSFRRLRLRRRKT